MTRFRLLVGLVAVLLPLVFCSFSSPPDWELKKEKNGIKVYTRDRDNSTLKEYKAVTTIQTSIENALDLLLNVTNYTTWQSNCIQSNIIERKDDNHFYTYILTEAPWPVSDRDIVMEQRVINEEDGSIIIDMKGLDNKTLVENHEKAIRMTYMVGFWKLTPTGEGVEVVQQVHADPEGKIPDWLANFAVVDSPYKTLSNMKNLLEK